MRPRRTIAPVLLRALALPAAAARDVAPRELIVKLDGQRHPRTRALPEGTGVFEAARRARTNPAVQCAAPNYVAPASVDESAVPNDPGTILGPPGVPGGWVGKQWNFLPWEGAGSPVLPTSPGGINAVGAWENLAAPKTHGARGVTVAVLDTGIAYRA